MFVLTSPAGMTINALAFSPDGRFLAAGKSETGVEVWDVAKQSLTLAAWREAFYIHQILFSSEGLHLYVSATQGGARVIDLQDGRDHCFTPHPDGIARSMALTRSKLLLVCVGTFGHRDAFLGAWDVESADKPRLMWRTPRTTKFSEYELPCLAPDEQSFAVKESGPGRPIAGLIAVRDTPTGNLVREFPRPSPSERYHRLVFTADGRLLLVVSDPNLYCLDASTGELIRTVGKPGRGSFADLALHPGGQVLVSTHRASRIVNLWDARTLSVMNTYAWPIGWFSSLALSPDGMLAAAGNESGKIVVWDMDV